MRLHLGHSFLTISILPPFFHHSSTILPPFSTIKPFSWIIPIRYCPWCWNIYQHLPWKSPSFVGKYTSTMVRVWVCFLNMSNQTILPLFEPLGTSDRVPPRLINRLARLIGNAGHLCKWIDALHVLVVMRSATQTNGVGSHVISAWSGLEITTWRGYSWDGKIM